MNDSSAYQYRLWVTLTALVALLMDVATSSAQTPLPTPEWTLYFKQTRSEQSANLYLDGTRLVTLERPDQGVQEHCLWDLSTGRHLASWPKNRGLVFPSETEIAIARDSMIVILSMIDGQEQRFIRAIESPDSAAIAYGVRLIDVSRDDQFIAVQTAKYAVQVHDSQSGAVRLSIPWVDLPGNYVTSSFDWVDHSLYVSWELFDSENTPIDRGAFHLSGDAWSILDTLPDGYNGIRPVSRHVFDARGSLISRDGSNLSGNYVQNLESGGVVLFRPARESQIVVFDADFQLLNSFSVPTTVFSNSTYGRGDTALVWTREHRQWSLDLRTQHLDSVDIDYSPFYTGGGYHRTYGGRSRRVMTQTRDVRSVWSRFYIYDLDLDTLVEALGPEGFPKRLAPPGGDPHSATLRIAVDSTISEIDHASGVVIKQESWPYQASHLYVESSDRWYSFDRYSEEIRAVRTLEPADVRVFDLNGIRMCPGERLGTFWTLFHDGRLELGNVKTGVVEKQFQLWPNSEEWDIGSVFKVVGDTLVIAMVRNSFDPSVEFSLIMQTVDGSDPLRSYPITVPTPEAEVSGQVDYSPRLGAAAMITHDADSVYLHLIPVEGTARVVALGGFDRVLHELGGHQVRFALDDSVICVHHVKDSVIVIVDSKTLKTLPGPEMRWRSPVVFDVVDSGRRLVYSYRVPIDNYNVVDLSTMETSSEYLGGGGLIQPLYDGRHLMRLRPNFFGIESAAIIDVMSGEQVKELWLSQFKPSVVGGFPFEQPLYSGSVQDTVLYAWGSAFFFLDDGVEYSNKVLNVDGPAELRPIGDQRDFAVFPQNSTRAGIVDPMFRSVITRLSLMNKEQPETMLKSSDGRWIAQRVATPTKVSALRLYRYDTSLDGDGDVPGYQVGRQVEVEGPLVLLSLDLSRTQPVCVYATGDGVVIKLDLRGQFIGRDTLVRSLTAPVSVYIAPNGRTVAILSLGQLQFVDLASNQELVTYRMPRILHGFHWGTDGRSFYLGHDYVEYSKYSLDSIVSATESNVDTKICDESVQIVQSGSKIDVYSGQYDGSLTIVDLLGRVIVTQRPVRMGEHTQVHLGSQSSGQLYVLFEGDACTTVRTLLNIR